MADLAVDGGNQVVDVEPCEERVAGQGNARDQFQGEEMEREAEEWEEKNTVNCRTLCL